MTPAVTAAQLKPGDWICTSSSMEPRDYLERVTEVEVRPTGAVTVVTRLHRGRRDRGYIFDPRHTFEVYTKEDAAGWLPSEGGGQCNSTVIHGSIRP